MIWLLLVKASLLLLGDIPATFWVRNTVMTMISSRQFARWLRERFASEKDGVILTREDINQLSGRQGFSLGFVNDIHYELMQHGIAFVTDTSRERFYLIPINSAQNWRKKLEMQYEKELYCNVFPIEKSG